MKAHGLPPSASVARKTLIVLAVAVAACVHMGGAKAQSVTLVMEAARVQRECATINNTGAAPARQPTGVVNPRCCSVTVLTPEDEIGRAIAAAFALAMLAGCIYLCIKAPKRR